MRNMKKNMKKKHEDRLTLIESHDGKTWQKVMKKIMKTV